MLHNVGIAGHNFSEQHEALVIEITRKFLEYAKAARLEAANPEIADRRRAESEVIEIRMTTDGFPIIPKVVMEKELKKSEWETLLRAFLTQHYCENISISCIETLPMIIVRSSQWTEATTGAVQRIENRYRKLYSE